MKQTRALESDRLNLHPVCYLLTGRTQSALTSKSHSFLICNMGLVKPTLKGCSEIRHKTMQNVPDDSRHSI